MAKVRILFIKDVICADDGMGSVPYKTGEVHEVSEYMADNMIRGRYAQKAGNRKVTVITKKPKGLTTKSMR